MATRVCVSNGPAPYVESVERQLRSRGLDLGTINQCDAALIFCASAEHWRDAEDTAPLIPTVVVFPELSFDGYIRALALGAGAVHIDNPSDVIVDVVIAVAGGEALLPLAVAQSLATALKDADQRALPATRLTVTERQIARDLLDGRTIGEIANHLSYSDRTIRRKLKGIYLKLGASNRNDAIEALHQSGLF